ncbi:MAG: hypothetical protein HYY24_14520 [Verrucomicrobia bacterium]|nr:hypothetical protein [Verrucomicrobiota bacterium]
MAERRVTAKKKLDYTEETRGCRLATKARKMASQHTPEQRRQHLDAAMVMIHGAPTQKKQLSLDAKPTSTWLSRQFHARVP